MKLKPCPFCGAIPQIGSLHERGVDKMRAILIRCISVDCEIRPSLGPFWNSEENTIAIWNRRKRKT